MLESPTHLLYDVDVSSLVRKTASDPSRRARLHAEAAALRQCAHPGVVGLVDIVDTPTTTELQLRRHGTRTLGNGWPSEPGAVLDVLAQVSSTIADLHSMQMVHGRIDASHILLDDEDRAVLCGLAEAAPVGSPTPNPSADIAHPAGLPRTAALDVAALGGLLADALAAMAATSRRADMQQRARLRALAERCLQPDLALRPTASEVSNALARAALISTSPRGRAPRRSNSALDGTAVSGRTVARGGALTLAAVCTTVALVRVDRPELPPGSPTEWGAWLGHTAAPDLVLALLRVAATGLAVYVAIATAVALLVALVPGNRIASALGTIVPRSIEGLTGIAVGAGLLSTLGGQFVANGSGIASAGAASALAPTATAPTAPAPATTAPAPSTTRARALPTAPTTAASTVAPSTVASNPPPTTTAARMVPPADAPTIDATPAGPTLAPHVHIVGRGDHLWAIARDTLEDALGRAPNDAEISAYWRRLIDQNRSRLVDPDNPDLIFAGQELILPAT